MTGCFPNEMTLFFAADEGARLHQLSPMRPPLRSIGAPWRGVTTRIGGGRLVGVARRACPCLVFSMCTAHGVILDHAHGKLTVDLNPYTSLRSTRCEMLPRSAHVNVDEHSAALSIQIQRKRHPSERKIERLMSD